MVGESRFRKLPNRRAMIASIMADAEKSKQMTIGTDFRHDLAVLINRHGLDNESNTPDFVLADYLACCLATFKTQVAARDGWFEHKKE